MGLSSIFFFFLEVFATWTLCCCKAFAFACVYSPAAEKSRTGNALNSDESSDDDSDLFVNTNHPPVYVEDEDEEDSDKEEDVKN